MDKDHTHCYILAFAMTLEQKKTKHHWNYITADLE